MRSMAGGVAKGLRCEASDRRRLGELSSQPPEVGIGGCFSSTFLAPKLCSTGRVSRLQRCVARRRPGELSSQPPESLSGAA